MRHYAWHVRHPTLLQGQRQKRNVNCKVYGFSRSKTFVKRQFIQIAICCILTGCCWLRRRLRSCGLAPGFERRSMGPWAWAWPLWATWLGGAPLTGGCWLFGPAALIVILTNVTQFKRRGVIRDGHLTFLQGPAHRHWSQTTQWLRQFVLW